MSVALRQAVAALQGLAARASELGERELGDRLDAVCDRTRMLVEVRPPSVRERATTAAAFEDVESIAATLYDVAQLLDRAPDGAAVAAWVRGVLVWMGREVDGSVVDVGSVSHGGPSPVLPQWKLLLDVAGDQYTSVAIGLALPTLVGDATVTSVEIGDGGFASAVVRGPKPPVGDVTVRPAPAVQCVVSVVDVRAA